MDANTHLEIDGSNYDARTTGPHTLQTNQPNGSNYNGRTSRYTLELDAGNYRKVTNLFRRKAYDVSVTSLKFTRPQFIRRGVAAAGIAVLAGTGYITYQSVRSKAYAPELCQISLHTGRVLDVALAGPEDGTPLVFHHGAPGARMPFEPFIEATVTRGLRYVSYSRPGFGDSTRQPGRTVADCATDTASILDLLGANRFYVTGWSAGGPHALACAGLLPKRVISAATIAGAAPYGKPDMADWSACQDPETLEKMKDARAGRFDELRSLLEREEPIFANVTGSEIIAALGNLPEVDKAVLTSTVADFLAANMREAYRNGIWGMYDEDIALARDWGFDVSQINVPVAVWQGTKDEMVPFAHGQWLANNVPHAQAHFLPGLAHFSLVFDCFGNVLDNLIANGKL